jgi:hypothetical protein
MPADKRQTPFSAKLIGKGSTLMEEVRREEE